MVSDFQDYCRSNLENENTLAFEMRTLAFDIVIICVSLTNCSLLWHSLTLVCLNLDREKKKT